MGAARARTVQWDDLTLRQKQLAVAVHTGMSNKEIAAFLGVCEASMKVLLNRLYHKIGFPEVTKGNKRLLLAVWVEQQPSLADPMPISKNPATLRDKHKK